MCFAYNLKTKTSDLRLPFAFEASVTDFESKVVPHKDGWVLVHFENFRMTQMHYSLIPHWSDTKKLKYTTYNARVETLKDKPTWRNSLKSRRCLVPLTEFYESVYEGPLAGHIVKFQSKERVLWSAGLWDVWKDRETQTDWFSFAIITKEPYPFVQSYGHDRSPFFLEPAFFQDWLNPDWKDADDVLLTMQKHLKAPELSVEKERPLKSGWEKRK